MLVIEGADNTGKTTLAHKLCELLPDHEYRHLGRPPDNFDFVWDYVALAAPNHIHDRLHLGEIGYAFAGVNGARCSNYEFMYLNHWLSLIPTMTILITADDELLANRHNKILQNGKKDELYTADKVVMANQAYRQLGPLMRSCFNTIHFNLTESYPWLSDQDVQMLVKEYKNLMQQNTTVFSRKPLLKTCQQH